MKPSYKPKHWYIKLIHIAKSQLQIDDDLYRANLKELTGKRSCSDMGIPDLVKVLEHMKKSGFKVKSTKGKSPKTRNKAESTHTMLDKLRQIWIQMHYQGFLRDSSEQALERWAAAQSKRLNKGVAINKLEWLDGRMQYQLIEQLKQWHMRALGNVIKQAFEKVLSLYKRSELTIEEETILNETCDQLNSAPNTHSTVSSAYSVYLDILKNHNKTV